MLCFDRPMRVLTATVLIVLTASAHSAEFPRSEMYPARSGHFSQDEERAIAVAGQKLAGGTQKPLDAFYKVTRRGKEWWVYVLATGGRPKWGQEGFVQPAFYTVAVSPKWAVLRVFSGWQQ